MVTINVQDFDVDKLKFNKVFFEFLNNLDHESKNDFFTL